MHFVNTLRLLTWMAVLANLVAILVFLYIFYILTFDPATADSSRLGSVFRIGSLIGAAYCWWQFRKELKKARSFKTKDMDRAYERPAAPFVITNFKNSPEIEDYHRDKLELLLTYGVLNQSDMDKGDVNEALNADEWDADSDSLGAILQQLQTARQEPCANLYCRYEQVETSAETYAELIDKIASMLELEELPRQLRMVMGNEKTVMHITWMGEEHAFEGEFPSKYLDWEVVVAIVNLFETEATTKRLYALSVSMQTVLTALEPKVVGALNDALRDEDAQPDAFIRVAQ